MPERHPIAVVVAMEAELAHFADHMQLVREERHGPWQDRLVRHPGSGTDLVLLCCGIGMTNAAAATEHLCATYAPRAVLNFGCGGAHRRDLLPGDVVIGNATVHHGVFHILSTGETYFPETAYSVTGETVASAIRPCDPALVALAQAVATGWTPDPWPEALGWPTAIEHRAAKVETGVVASADIWTQFHERIDDLHRRHRSLCEDMEAAAAHQICDRYGVPFLTVKDISNNEFHAVSNLEGDIEVLPAAEIGRRAATLLLRLLERLPAGSPKI